MGDKSELVVIGTDGRHVTARRRASRTHHTGSLRLIAAIFIFAFIISSVPFVGADRNSSEFSFKLVGDLKGEVVDNGTLAPVNNVTIWGEVHSRVLSFKIQLNSDHYSYWIFDKETKTLLCSYENLQVTRGCFSLPLDNYLESGTHTFALTAWAPGYKSTALSGEYCVGDPSNNSFLTIELEHDNDNGASGLSLTVTPGEAVVTRRQAQVQSGTQRVSLANYQSSRRSDGSPVYGSSTPRWSSSTSLVSPEQYNANTSSYQKVSTTTGFTSVQAGYSVPIYGWQKTGVETVTLAADTSVAVRVAYAIMGYTVAEKYTNWTNIYCLSKTDGTWKDTGKTVECWWPNRGAPAASSGYKWVKTCDGWISTFYKEQYNAVEYFKAQGYTITSTSTGYSASKRIPRLDGYTATKDVYGWASTGSQQVGMDAGSRDLISVNSDSTAQMKYAYSEKTARCESRSSTMYSVKTLDGYDRAIVGYDVPVYTQGWTSDPVNATITLVGNFNSSVRLEVQAPAGIEATLSQADLNLEAGEQAQVGLRVRVSDSRELMAGSCTITVTAIDRNGDSSTENLLLKVVDSQQVEVEKVSESGVSFTGDSATVAYLGYYSLQEVQETGFTDLVEKVVDWTCEQIVWKAAEKGAEWAVGNFVGQLAGKIAGKAVGAFGFFFGMLADAPLAGQTCKVQLAVHQEGEKLFVLAALQSGDAGMGEKDIVFTTDSPMDPWNPVSKPRLHGEWRINKDNLLGCEGIDVITLNGPILLTSGRTYKIEARADYSLPLLEWEHSTQDASA